MDLLNKDVSINYNSFAEESIVYYNEDKLDISRNDKQITRFIKLLNSQFEIYHNVSDYSNQLGIKPKSLLRLCKKEGLKNPVDIIKLKLLSEAKNQLLFTNKSIKDICFDLGFSDPAYFSRFFKKNGLISAQNFRRLNAESMNVKQMEKSTI